MLACGSYELPVHDADCNPVVMECLPQTKIVLWDPVWRRSHW
jgi:hypothetical protein